MDCLGGSLAVANGVSGGERVVPPDHYCSMSLASQGPATMDPQPKRYEKIASRDINRTTDIEGASAGSLFHTAKYTNKPARESWTEEDVPGCVPRPLIRERNVPDNSLRIDDIDGTRRTIKDRMMRTNRHVDPLNPVYPLPAFTPADPVIPKFVRDSFNVNDIDGTAPRAKREFVTRDNMSINDIEGARPGLRERARLSAMQPRDLLHTSDVSGPQGFSTTRQTDPNAPVYSIHGMVIADGSQARPKQPPGYIPNYQLTTKDVTADGREDEALNYIGSTDRRRREFRVTNFLGDISGASSDSHHHSIVTKRVTHPLDPVYRSLDDGSALKPVVTPLVPPDLVRVPTLPPSSVPISASKTPSDLPPSGRQQSGGIAGGAWMSDTASTNMFLSGGVDSWSGKGANFFSSAPQPTQHPPARRTSAPVSTLPLGAATNAYYGSAPHSGASQHSSGRSNPFLSGRNSPANSGRRLSAGGAAAIESNNSNTRLAAKRAAAEHSAAVDSVRQLNF